MKTNRLVAASAVFVILFGISGCKDDVPALEYHSQGFVKGTITGIASDDVTAIDEDFRYTQYQQTLVLGEAFTGYIPNTDGSLQVYIFRQDLSDGGYIYITFELEDEHDTTPDDAEFQFAYFKESDKIFQFIMYDNVENVIEITDFSFDMASGKTTGTFAIEGPGNTTQHEASVEGSFDVQLKQFVY